jgi:hypothetical protein
MYMYSHFSLNYVMMRERGNSKRRDYWAYASPWQDPPLVFHLHSGAELGALVWFVGYDNAEI